MTALLPGLVAVLAIALTGVVLRRRLMVVTVCGASMRPTFADGDRLLVSRNGSRAVRRNALIVLAYDTEPLTGPAMRELMVKRVAAGPGDAVPAGMPVPERLVPPSRMLVIGDNAAGSADSRRVGYYATSSVVGAVLRRL
jgi:signal peptidase I